MFLQWSAQLLLVLIIVLFLGTNDDNCHLTEDETISVCAAEVTLNADEGFSDYTWNTGETGKSIKVTRSGSYYWEVVNITDNKVANGDFEDSDHYAGFTSSYIRNVSSLLDEGTYAVVRNPKSVHDGFSKIGDHTSGNGYMMVVNGAKAENVTVWTETITIKPLTAYVFSIWAAPVNSSNPGKLSFSINGKNVGNIFLTSVVGSWENYTTRWTSDAVATTATIGIVNQNTEANGNDFAIDDIQFSSLCRKTFHVNLYASPSKPAIEAI